MNSVFNSPLTVIANRYFLRTLFGGSTPPAAHSAEQAQSRFIRSLLTTKTIVYRNDQHGFTHLNHWLLFLRCELQLVLLFRLQQPDSTGNTRFVA